MVHFAFFLIQVQKEETKPVPVTTVFLMVCPEGSQTEVSTQANNPMARLQWIMHGLNVLTHHMLTAPDGFLNKKAMYAAKLLFIYLSLVSLQLHN